MAMNQIRNSVLLILIWVQTVCKCFQQTPKVTASKEWMRLHSAGSKIIPEFLWISWSLWAIQNSLSIVYVWYIRAVTILLLSMLLSWDCCCKYYLSTDQNWIWKKNDIYCKYLQFDLGLHCLTQQLLKHLSRWQNQTTFVVVGALRVNYYQRFHVWNSTLCPSWERERELVSRLGNLCHAQLKWVWNKSYTKKILKCQQLLAI